MSKRQDTPPPARMVIDHCLVDVFPKGAVPVPNGAVIELFSNRLRVTLNTPDDARRDAAIALARLDLVEHPMATDRCGALRFTRRTRLPDAAAAALLEQAAATLRAALEVYGYTVWVGFGGV